MGMLWALMALSMLLATEFVGDAAARCWVGFWHLSVHQIPLRPTLTHDATAVFIQHGSSPRSILPCRLGYYVLAAVCGTAGTFSTYGLAGHLRWAINHPGADGASSGSDGEGEGSGPGRRGGRSPSKAASPTGKRQQRAALAVRASGDDLATAAQLQQELGWRFFQPLRGGGAFVAIQVRSDAGCGQTASDKGGGVCNIHQRPHLPLWPPWQAFSAGSSPTNSITTMSSSLCTAICPRLQAFGWTLYSAALVGVIYLFWQVSRAWEASRERRHR